MVFLHPQSVHPLIPQAHTPEENIALANETKNFRQEFMFLLKNKIEELAADFPKSDNYPEWIFDGFCFW